MLSGSGTKYGIFPGWLGLDGPAWGGGGGGGGGGFLDTSGRVCGVNPVFFCNQKIMIFWLKTHFLDLKPNSALLSIECYTF